MEDWLSYGRIAKTINFCQEQKRALMPTLPRSTRTITFSLPTEMAAEF